MVCRIYDRILTVIVSEHLEVVIIQDFGDVIVAPAMLSCTMANKHKSPANQSGRDQFIINHQKKFYLDCR